MQITSNPKPPVSITVTPPTFKPLKQEGSHSDCDAEELPIKREEDNDSDTYFSRSSDLCDGIVPGTLQSSVNEALNVSSKEFDSDTLTPNYSEALAASASNWADCMDAIGSPMNEGIFTIPYKPAKGKVRGLPAGLYPGYETCVLPFGHFNGSEKWERLN